MRRASGDVAGRVGGGAEVAGAERNRRVNREGKASVDRGRRSAVATKTTWMMMPWMTSLAAKQAATLRIRSKTMKTARKHSRTPAGHAPAVHYAARSRRGTKPLGTSSTRTCKAVRSDVRPRAKVVVAMAAAVDRAADADRSS